MKNQSFYLIIIFILLTFQFVVAQKQYPLNYFIAPLDIPLESAGSFGELRTNHFHSGIDLRTKEKEGLKVYASANGYVSRIKVSPLGFGNALYITHPNGYVTVYAHLKSFNREITNYLRKIQYAKESYEVDLALKYHELKIKKGEIIALSGNSGSSDGPHLHFEIREQKTEKPVNPLLFGLKITDTIPPTFNKIICFDEISGNNFKIDLKLNDGKYFLSPKDSLYFPSVFSLGISAYDLMNNNMAQNGIYKLQLKFDTVIVNSFSFDKFSFDESRYINAFINYRTFIRDSEKYIQTKLLPGNKLSIYDSISNSGIMKIDDNNWHLISYSLCDFSGNCSKLNFMIRRNPDSYPATYSNISDSNLFIDFNKEKTIFSDNYKIYFPLNSLYDNLLLKISENNDSNKFLSKIIEIHDNTVPLHKSISVSLKTDSIADSLKSKLLIVRLKDDGKIKTEGGKFIDGFVKTNINNFGKFAVSIDSTAPLIKALNYNQKQMDIRQKTLDFIISDNLSGISKYRGELNGKWVLMEFNGKSNELTYFIDEKLKPGANQLKIIVEDNKQNKRELNLIIYK